MATRDANGWSKAEADVMHRLDANAVTLREVVNGLFDLKIEVTKLQVKSNTKQYMWAGIFGSLPATIAFLYIFMTQ